MPVSINKAQTANFLLALSTNNLCLGQALVKKLGLVPQPLLRQGKPVLRQGQPAQTVKLDHIDLGELDFNVASGIVVPDAGIAAPGSQIDGLLGINAIAPMATEILDSTHRLRVIYPGGLTADQVKAEGFDPALALPLTAVNEGGAYSVPVQLSNGTKQQTVDFILSTEATDTACSESLAASLGLPTTKRALTPGSKSLVSTWRVPSLSLGSLHLSKIGMMDLDSAQQGDFHGMPVLGMNVLSQYDILLDIPAKKMYLKSIASNASAAATSATPNSH